LTESRNEERPHASTGVVWVVVVAAALAACAPRPKTPAAELGPPMGPPQPAQVLGALPDDAAIIASSMRWKPDRQGFASWELYVLRDDGGGATRLTFAEQSHQHAAVAPDRRHVATNRAPSEPAKRLGVFWIDLAEKTERAVAPSFWTAGAGGVDVSRDGWIYFAGEPREKEGNDLFRVRTDGAALERLTETPEPEFDVSVSDDGTKIAFVRVTGFLLWVKTEVWIADADGSNAVRIFDGGEKTGRQGPFPYGGYDPEIAPGGRSVVFSRTNPGGDNFGLGAHDLWIASADGTGAPRRLTEPGPIAMIPDWRGDAILFTSFDEEGGYVGLATVPAAGGPVHRLESGLAQLWDGARHGKWIPALDREWPHAGATSGSQ
jgi:hypothetical protein